jgi:nitronate monooxygenase
MYRNKYQNRRTMWYNTQAAKMLNIQYPILQGPFGGNLSSVKLVSTVSNLGGLGGYGAYTLSPEEIISVDLQIKAATNKPYNINLWVSDTDAPAGGIDDGRYEETRNSFPGEACTFYIKIREPGGSVAPSASSCI